ncbi:dnaJ homolog subfamily C member 17 [Halyomorpha halys]|uniref:dnaJ homolog subfamily C member 17 n=1 Tax=Halyomorpha halys TaxID=286706 RepID=UPI0006D5105B|nr:dnaJ homolog subfamily C member 17 [Halyomorpha halys]
MAKPDITDQDLYAILEIESTATAQEIKKAYRKKALKCHPDKNPDNINATELFLQLSNALEVLLDDKARLAYDKIYNAKKAAKIRNQELDSHRKKLKEELEARERQAAQESFMRFGNKSAEEKLAAEIERLRKEGSRQLKEEMEFIKKKILEERQLMTGNADPSLYRLKVKWKCEKNDETNGGYNTDNLVKMFSKYGDVDTVIVSQKKKGSALVEFIKADAAIKALQLEKGLINNPLTLTWLTGEPPSQYLRKMMDQNLAYRNSFINYERIQSRLFPSAETSNSNNHRPIYNLPKAKTYDQDDADEDFEMRVLRKMREAEESKRKAAAMNE